MDQKEIQALVLVVTVVILVLAIALVLFFSYFQQKKTAYLLKQRETQLRFEEEINKSKLEIQEQALQNISWEIHDNVGQLLSVAKMQLNMVQFSLPEAAQDKIKETSDIVGKSLQELRDLAKSLNAQSIKNRGLIPSIELEIKRFNKLNFLKCELQVEGETYQLSNDKEIIIFRILQEFFSNTIKHAKAKELHVEFNFKPEELEINIADDGLGFEINKNNVKKGIGLTNMQSRANLIDAELTITSEKNKGTNLFLSCKK